MALKAADEICGVYAKGKAIMGIVCAIIVGIVLSMVGYNNWQKGQKYTVEHKGTINNSNPCLITTCGSRKRPRTCYDCNFEMTYNDSDNQTIQPNTIGSSSSNTLYKKGQTIAIACNRDDPKDCVLEAPFEMISIGSLCCGVCIVIISIICAILTFKFKWFRRFTCAQDAADAIFN